MLAKTTAILQKYWFCIENIGKEVEKYFFANIGVIWLKCKFLNIEAIIHTNLANLGEDIANTD